MTRRPLWRPLRRVAAPFLCAAAIATAAGAAPATPTDPAQEGRAHALFRQIRCVVCQNESIDDSEAPLAGDLRDIVREQIVAGRDDAQIRRFLTDRYGDFVLLKPRFTPATALLWTAPFAIVLIGLGGFAWSARATPAATPLTVDERARLGQIVGRATERSTRTGSTDTLPPDTRLTKGFDVG